MAERHEYLSYARSLKDQTAETRLRLIESELSLSLTFCNLADTEISYGQFGQASKLAQKIRKTIAAVSGRIRDERYIPVESVSRIERQLEHLNKRADSIDKRVSLRRVK